MRKEKTGINLMFTVMLLAIFSLSAIFVAVMGAKIYSSNAGRMQENYDSRTSLVYLSEKLRSQDADSVKVIKVAGGDALSIDGPAEPGAVPYATVVYVYEGTLRELTVIKDSPSAEPIFEPSHSPAIMPINSLTLRKDEKGIDITVITAGGLTESIFIGWRTAS